MLNNKILQEVRKEHELKNPNTNLKDYTSKGLICIIFCIILGVIYLVDYLSNNQLRFTGMKINERIMDGDWYRLFTFSLYHANLLHLIVNSYAILCVGEILEFNLGKSKFIFVCIASQFLAGLTSTALTAANTVGASGIAFGMVGSVIGMSYILDDYTKRNVKIWLVLIIAINVIMAFFNPQIDNWSHIGGFLGGMLITQGIGIRHESSSYKKKDISLIIYTILCLFFILAIIGVIRIPRISLVDFLKGIWTVLNA